MIQHIIPVNDLEDHSEEVKNHIGLMIPMCKCDPKVKQEYLSDDIIFVHNSFDGREGVEWVNEILNQKNINHDTL